jgi:pyruvate formate lyase activating enzyme
MSCRRKMDQTPDFAVLPPELPRNAAYTIMMRMESGSIGHIQRFSLHDGPGIRTTVFFQGCPLACEWCHNPENRCPQPQVITVESRCIHCGGCAQVCPREEVGTSPVGGGGETADCRLCGACVEACPTGARQTTGRRMSVSEVLAEICKDAIFYQDSQGGVTFSGGEPLAQPEFLQSLLRACSAEGIHTAVDTCGFAAPEQALAVAAAADLMLYDLKIVDDAKHIRFTGVSNALILKNLEALGKSHGKVWLRIPIIPGLNDAEEDLDAMARFAACLSGVRQINLLPYHKTGVHKFARLGWAYELGHVAPPSPQDMESVARRFRAMGLPTKIGG